jgi:SRSO17 transposase
MPRPIHGSGWAFWFRSVLNSRDVSNRHVRRCGCPAGARSRQRNGWDVGRPPKLLRRDDKHKPVSVKQLALGLPGHAWRKIIWREATAEKLSSRFARVRIRVAHRDYWLLKSRPEEWLLIEWPDSEKEPIKYWLSTLPEDVAFRQFVDIAKLRWRIERDYQELKQEVGLAVAS